MACRVARTVPVCGSHSNPPLHHPVRHVGPVVILKLQSLLPLRAETYEYEVLNRTRARTHIRPAFQLSGTGKVTEVNGAASQLITSGLAPRKKSATYPVGKLGTAVPADRSVYICAVYQGTRASEWTGRAHTAGLREPSAHSYRLI